MSKLSKNDIAWQQIFDKYDIIEKVQQNGQFEITATAIKGISGREARLMAKFDNRANLPRLFQKYHLSILPITRGSYVIAPFETYQDFPTDMHGVETIYIQFPEHIESIDPNNITSETAAVNSAFLSGILANFIDDDEELIPTVNGRMSSNSFSFKINNVLTKKQMPIYVQNSQIEIDVAYEGVSTLSLIEVKNNIADDFLVRQLYYPYRRWQEQLRKQVKTIFVVYTNNSFFLYEYIFNSIDDYNSVKLNKMRKYCFEPLDIGITDIEKIISNTCVMSEPTNAPFPQADSFARVINLCELLQEDSLTKEEITINYDFDMRQTDYYFNAGKYLGLFELSNEQICLTETATKILTLAPRAKQLEFVKLIMQHAPFRMVLEKHLKTSQPPTKEEVIEIMKMCNLNRIGDKTYERRSSTVIAWVNWILDLAR
ncbi:MAG: hypothetical protein K2X04_04950 [Burkholderiales bacterium]|nr:hypothetical protein [Burkholderiales bacterium]